jgi:hypothetical protein
MCKQCKQACSAGRRKRRRENNIEDWRVKTKKSRDEMREKDSYMDWLFKVGICNQICFNGYGIVKLCVESISLVFIFHSSTSNIDETQMRVGTTWHCLSITMAIIYLFIYSIFTCQYKENERKIRINILRFIRKI